MVLISLNAVVTTNYTQAFKCYHMSLVMRKAAFCICENKDADQLRGNRAFVFAT